MGDQTVVVLVVGVLIVALIGFLVWVNRRWLARERLRRKEAEGVRVAERGAALAELDQHGRLLYQLIERVDGLSEVEQEQARELASIRSAVTIICVLMVLGAIVGILVGLSVPIW